MGTLGILAMITEKGVNCHTCSDLKVNVQPCYIWFKLSQVFRRTEICSFFRPILR